MQKDSQNFIPLDDTVDELDERIDGIMNLVYPLDYRDGLARAGAAEELIAKTTQPFEEEPRLPGDFGLPGQMISITGISSPMIEAPQGEMMTTLSEEEALGLFWYGSGRDIDHAMCELADKIQAAMANSDSNPSAAQYLLAKWRHPDIERAVLGIFISGDLTADDIDPTRFETIWGRKIQDDDAPCTLLALAENVHTANLGPDEDLAFFEILNAISVSITQRSLLAETFEDLHPAAFAIAVEDGLKNAWRARMTNRP